MPRPSISFFLMNFVLLSAVIGFIIVVFDLNGYAFVFELGILLIFMFLIALSMFFVYHNKNWGWAVLGSTLILTLLNVLFIMLISKEAQVTQITTTFFIVIGLILTAINLKWAGSSSGENKDYEETSNVKDDTHSMDNIEPKEETKTGIEEHSIAKTFSPGKFIASKKANKFHSPKCDWAKRISKSNQIWFGSRQDAESKGFEADKCIN